MEKNSYTKLYNEERFLSSKNILYTSFGSLLCKNHNENTKKSEFLVIYNKIFFKKNNMFIFYLYLYVIISKHGFAMSAISDVASDFL